MTGWPAAYRKGANGGANYRGGIEAQPRGPYGAGGVTAEEFAKYTAELPLADSFQGMPQVLQPEPVAKLPATTPKGRGIESMPRGRFPTAGGMLGRIPFGGAARAASSALQLYQKARSLWDVEEGPTPGSGWTKQPGGCLPPVFVCGPEFAGNAFCVGSNCLGGQAGDCYDPQPALQTWMQGIGSYYHEEWPPHIGKHVRFYSFAWCRPGPGPVDPLPRIRPPRNPAVGPAGGGGAPAPIPEPGHAPEGGNGDGAPPVLDEGKKEPPGPRTREIKVRSGALWLVRRSLNPVTEAIDAIECLHKAMPARTPDGKRLRRPIVGRRLKGDRTGSTIFPRMKNAQGKWVNNPNYIKDLTVPVHQTPQTMLAELYKGWDYIDWIQAVDCLAKNHLMDYVIGKSASTAQKNFSSFLSRTGRKPWESHWQWGPAL